MPEIVSGDRARIAVERSSAGRSSAGTFTLRPMRSLLRLAQAICSACSTSRAASSSAIRMALL